jgi:spermidine synthase
MPRLLALESPLPERHAMLRLLEPPGSCRQSLWESVLDGTYNKPFIVDHGPRRFLHFDLDAVQSAMHLEHPDRLSLAYTRKMMAFLLFNRTPARILLLGLGGGSLAKFCYRCLPSATIPD